VFEEHDPILERTSAQAEPVGLFQFESLMLGLMTSTAVISGRSGRRSSLAVLQQDESGERLSIA